MLCKNIKKGDKTACEQEKTKTCATGGYWEKRDCEAAIVAKHDACQGDEFKDLCAQHRKLYADLCVKAANADDSNPKSVDAWKARRAEYEQKKGSWSQFLAEWGACKAQCSGITSWPKYCANAAEKYKKKASELDASSQRDKTRRAALDKISRKHRAQMKTEEEAFKKLLASVNGDRRKVLRQEGVAPDVAKGGLAKAATWVYRVRRSEDYPWCTITYTFKGDKQVGRKQTGRGCPYLK